MNKTKIALICLSVLLLGALASCYMIWKKGNDRNRELEEQLAELRILEKRSTIVKGVSKRMEQIAFQQKMVSDDRSEKAIEQAKIAQEMTRKAELERENALRLQQIATSSEESAREAYRNAEEQRIVADQQRLAAEQSKRIADTLSYIALSHSLGLRAVSLYQAGETEQANLLAYASYIFSRDYKGDMYNPSVYQALSLSSQNTIIQGSKNGSVTGLELLPGARNKLITTSVLGDIFAHESNGETFTTSYLFSDSEYRFKGSCLGDDGEIYAISRTGHLVIVQASTAMTRVVPIDQVANPSYVTMMNGGRQVLIVGTDAMSVYDTTSGEIVDTQPLTFEVTCVGTDDGKPLLFDSKGHVHKVSSLSQMTDIQLPVDGVITAYARSADKSISAYGTNDGTIYCVYADGTVDQLVGHRSKISDVQFKNNNLYSSSLDGTLKLWMLSQNKQEPLTLIKTSQWILRFVLDQDGERLWATTSNGNLMEHVFSVSKLGEKVRQKLKRNLTQEEWNNYIGNNIQYQRFIDA